MLVGVFFWIAGPWLGFGSNAAGTLDGDSEDTTGFGIAGTIASAVAAFAALSCNISFGRSLRLTPDFLWRRSGWEFAD